MLSKRYYSNSYSSGRHGHFMFFVLNRYLLFTPILLNWCHFLYFVDVCYMATLACICKYRQCDLQTDKDTDKHVYFTNLKVFTPWGYGINTIMFLVQN